MSRCLSHFPANFSPEARGRIVRTMLVSGVGPKALALAPSMSTYDAANGNHIDTTNADDNRNKPNDNKSKQGNAPPKGVKKGRTLEDSTPRPTVMIRMTSSTLSCHIYSPVFMLTRLCSALYCFQSYLASFALPEIVTKNKFRMGELKQKEMRRSAYCKR